MIDRLIRKIKNQEKPKHIAISISGNREWAKNKKKAYKDVFFKGFMKIPELLKIQVELNIPIFTYYLIPKEIETSDIYPTIMDALADFLEKFIKNDILSKNKIKVSILGKWYNLPGRVVDLIKQLIDETSDYDSFFLNFCINYDGQEEIVDACKIISRKVKSGKMDPDAITNEDIKENLYSSYFLPPDLMIITGGRRYLSSFLLWDSIKTTIHFSDRLWPEFKDVDLIRAINYYQRLIKQKI